MNSKKYTILIADTAIDFGGSIVSTANLIRGLDRSRFEPIFVTATNERLVRNRLAEAASTTKVYVVRKLMHYARIGRVTAVFRRARPNFVAKLLIYTLYLVRWLLNLPYVVKMAWLLHRHDVDLVQLNNAFGNDELELLCLAMRRKRVVFFRGYVPLGAIERTLFLGGTCAFVSVSDYVKKEAVDDGVPAEKIVVATPPAIPEELDQALRDAVRGRYGISSSEPVVGIFGRVVEWKGQKEFLRAAAVVLKTIPDAKMFIVGDTSDGESSYFDEVRALVSELHMEDRTIFTGYIDRVHELYSIMDVVVHASIAPEPSGRVIFESMSYGIPVVASCLGGPKEFIDHGIDGYICDPTATNDLAGHVSVLLANPDLRRAMGERARAKIDRKYNKDVYAREVERVYERTLGATN